MRTQILRVRFEEQESEKQNADITVDTFAGLKPWQLYNHTKTLHQ